MNFGEALLSDSMEAHARAALFLRAQGASGYEFLPLLLQRCQSVDLSQRTLSKYEEMLVGYGALSLGTIIGAHGFDACDAFHAKVLEWLIDLTFSRISKSPQTDSMALVTCVHYLVRQSND